MSAPSIALAPFRITICGIDELPEHCAAGVTHVVSILDPDWPPLDAFGAFGPHRRIDLRFHDVIDPMPGAVVPHARDVARILDFGAAAGREAGGPIGDTARAAPHVLIHCHAGLSRSTASAALLIAQSRPELAASEIFAAIGRVRPRAWPNLRLIEFGDAQLGRRGEIVAAAAEFYRRALDREPVLADLMIDGGRGREVEAALGRYRS